MHPFESYLREIRYSGAAVQETSYYGPLAALLNEAGSTLRPRDVIGWPDGFRWARSSRTTARHGTRAMTGELRSGGAAARFPA